MTQQRPEALHDDNPKYFAQVTEAMQKELGDLSPSERISEAMRHRELIGEFTDRYKFDDYPETGALLFIWGALKYPNALFKKPFA